MEENQTPGTQDKSEKLLFGKFKTQEEAEAAMKELERKNTELNESLDREQRLNALLSSEEKTPGSAPAEPQSTAQWVPQGVFDEDQGKAIAGMLENYGKTILNETQKVVRQEIGKYAAKENARTQFYSAYPELKGFESEVDLEADRLVGELGQERMGRMGFDVLAKEVATRTKTRLNELKRKVQKTALHLESGGVNEPEVEEKSSKPKASSEEERTQSFFQEEVRAFNERKNRPLRG